MLEICKDIQMFNLVSYVRKMTFLPFFIFSKKGCIMGFEKKKPLRSIQAGKIYTATVTTNNKNKNNTHTHICVGLEQV